MSKALFMRDSSRMYRVGVSGCPLTGVRSWHYLVLRNQQTPPSRKTNPTSSIATSKQKPIVLSRCDGTLLRMRMDLTIITNSQTTDHQSHRDSLICLESARDQMTCM